MSKTEIDTIDCDHCGRQISIHSIWASADEATICGDCYKEERMRDYEAMVGKWVNKVCKEMTMLDGTEHQRQQLRNFADELVEGYKALALDTPADRGQRAAERERRVDFWFQPIKNHLDELENMGGPEEDEYVSVMLKIARECINRVDTYELNR